MWRIVGTHRVRTLGIASRISESARSSENAATLSSIQSFISVTTLFPQRQASTTNTSSSSSSTSSIPPPPQGSRAAAIYQAAVSGTYDAAMLQQDARKQLGSGADAALKASSSSSTASSMINNPYIPHVEYSARFATSKKNPVEHTFAHAGRYFDFGSAAEIEKMFPSGIAGDLNEEWAITGTHAMLVRPEGVRMVNHFESWRQERGRALAATGANILDIDTSKPVASSSSTTTTTTTAAAAAAAQEPPTREAFLSGGGSATTTSSSSTTTASTSNSTSSNTTTWDRFHPFRLLVGARGSGKSALLNYAVHYGRSNRWIVVYIPDSFEIMNMGKVLVPSRLRPGMVDQHDMALKILKDFITAQGDLLAQVPQRLAYAKFRYLPAHLDKEVSATRNKLRDTEEAEKSKLKAQADALGRSWDPSTYKSKYEDESDTAVDRKTFTLRDMAAWGVSHPTAATDTLLHLLGELRLCTEFPVLVAVDGVNELYGPSAYPEAGNGELLPASRLSIPSAFHCLGADGFRPEFAMKRGIWLASMSFKHSKSTSMFDQVAVRGRFRVPVPSLTRQETFSILSHYAQSGAFLMLEGIKTVDAFLVEYYRMLTGGNPREMFLAALFTPQSPPSTPRNKNFRERE